MGEIWKRHGGFTIRWYEGGRRRVLATKQTSHADAKRMLAEIEARVARGELGIPERRAAWPTVSELVERFLREYTRPKIKDLARYRAHARSKLQKVLPHIGKISVGELQQVDVARLRDAIAKRYAAGTVYVCLATLSTLFSWALRHDLAPRNPCKGVERPTADPSIDYLTSEEVQHLLEATRARATTLKGSMLHVGVALAVHTGLRKGELCGLRWSDLEVTTRRLTVARSYRTTPKSNKPRHLRLPSLLVPILEAWRPHCPRSPDNVVLPVGKNETKTGGSETMLGLRQLMIEIGLRDVPHPWHLLRHTFASHYVMAGGNLLALQKILGHADPKTTLVYAHLAPDFLGDEMDRVSYAKRLSNETNEQRSHPSSRDRDGEGSSGSQL
jgi:integrase